MVAVTAPIASARRHKVCLVIAPSRIIDRKSGIGLVVRQLPIWPARLFLLDVPEHRDRRGDVAAHAGAPRQRLYELAERHRDADVEHALLDLLGDRELLLGIALAQELHAQLLDLLVERPAEL